MAAAIPEKAFVIEIGGGTGALTAALADRASSIQVLEIDRGLCAILRERFRGSEDRVRVIEGDALEFNYAAALEAQPAPRAICGNLPYNITTPLLERIVACSDEWEAAVLMVQREYGRRLTARPRTADYGSLTIFVAHYCTSERLFDIGAAGFYPPPAVASTVIRLTPRRDRNAGVRNEALLLWLIRAAFAQRRKLFANSVASTLRNASGRAAVEEAMRSAGVAPSARAEQLRYDDFVRIANALHSAGLTAPLGYRGAAP